jgi:hypothetical protein
MSDLERVLSRLAVDHGFADAVRERPEAALRGYDLDDHALRRLEAALDTRAGPDRSADADATGS